MKNKNSSRYTTNTKIKLFNCKPNLRMVELQFQNLNPMYSDLNLPINHLLVILVLMMLIKPRMRIAYRRNPHKNLMGTVMITVVMKTRTINLKSINHMLVLMQIKSLKLQLKDPLQLSNQHPFQEIMLKM